MKYMGSFVKGMTVGVTVGAITYAVTSTSSKQKRKIRRTATKAMKTVGSVIDSISYMMR
jgi:gas vesicle protein